MNQASRPLLALFAAALLASSAHAQPARVPSAGAATGATPTRAPTQNLVSELQDISRTYRATYKSSNRWSTWNGWRHGWGSTPDTANDRQASEIDRLKAEGLELMGHAQSRHAGILAYAARLEATTVDGSHVGNCGDIGAVVYSHIFNRFSGLDITLVGRQDGDHHFVLVRDANQDIYIADGWSEGGRVAGPLRLSAERVLVLKGTSTPVGPPWAGPVVNLGGGDGKDWVRTRGSTVTNLSLAPAVPPPLVGPVLERVVPKTSLSHKVAATNRDGVARTLRVGVFGPTRARVGGATVTLQAGATKALDLEELLRGCRVGAPCDASRPRVGRYVIVCSDLPYAGVAALAPVAVGPAGVQFAFTYDPRVCEP